MKIKTSELTGAALDWAVATIEYPNDTMVKEGIDLDLVADSYPFSTNWSQGGPISEREKISYLFQTHINQWWATNGDAFEEETLGQFGPTPLVAAMRCYVASRLGDEVDVPEGLA